MALVIGDTAPLSYVRYGWGPETGGSKSEVPSPIMLSSWRMARSPETASISCKKRTADSPSITSTAVGTVAIIPEINLSSANLSFARNNGTYSSNRVSRYRESEDVYLLRGNGFYKRHFYPTISSYPKSICSYIWELSSRCYPTLSSHALRLQYSGPYHQAHA